MKFKTLARRLAIPVAIASGLLSLTACVPLMVGGAMVSGTMVATDRRTSGTVLEDNGIAIKANNRVTSNLGERVHVNVTSYNRQVLLTGEVPSEQDKQLVEKVVSGVENVRNIVNELAVMGNSTLTQRASDGVVTSRVKANLIDAKDLIANAFKITTERGTVYVMGRVTQREANRATEIITRTSGVQRLVRIFEVVSEDELARELPTPAPAQK
jgi:osmotically-inducible protein OsmY